MSHCRGILSGKEHRKPYRRPKAIDYSCTNHGSCVRCREGRLHNSKRRMLIAEDTLDELHRFCKRFYKRHFTRSAGKRYLTKR